MKQLNKFNDIKGVFTEPLRCYLLNKGIQLGSRYSIFLIKFIFFRLSKLTFLRLIHYFLGIYGFPRHDLISKTNYNKLKDNFSKLNEKIFYDFKFFEIKREFTPDPINDSQ